MERPVNDRRKHMTNKERAAQFMPFAALTGFGAVINETSRQTAQKHTLSDEEYELLNENLNRIIDKISEKPEVKVLYFVPDKTKQGGSYESFTGNVRRVDTFERVLIFTDKTIIKIQDIMLIELL
ncbi:MAG: hypothetical protein IIU39_02795 [Ruminococcus sp.]|nr:hypothetical protein [Ruminococcus sp.]